VRLWGTADHLAPEPRIESALLTLPRDVVLGGWASLWWQGVRALDGRAGPGGSSPVPILVHIGTSARIRPRDGLVVDRSAVAADDICEVAGVRCSTPLRAVVDVMCRDGIEEGLVVGDAACAAGLVRPAQVQAHVSGLTRRRGLPHARAAAPLVSERSASGPETRLRYVWVVRAGLPPPLVNAAVFDSRGYLAGVADLLDDAAGLVGEYDGAQHRELTAHTADNDREERLESLGLTVVRATALDLWPRREHLVRRLVARHAGALGRDRSQDSWSLQP
jgi:hypothetical protein